MNNKTAGKIWDVILIGCVVALVVALVILAVVGVESACGSPGDIECPGPGYPAPTREIPDPYPAPFPVPTVISKAWHEILFPIVFGGG